MEQAELQSQPCRLQETVWTLKTDLCGAKQLDIPLLLDTMPCPVCNKPIGEDHRWCVFELLKENKIQDVSEWTEMCKPKTIIKGKIKVRIPKEL